FNSYFQTCEPEARFTRRMDHELYCCGHFIEAAVAYYNATGKDKLLRAMCRYADLVEKVFKIEHTASFYTPGHEEIELALVKLYRCTGEKRYLELSEYFLNERSHHDDVSYRNASPYWVQDHVPVREMDTAEGHAVRACYLYSAMADAAFEYGDEQMFNACRRIFENISNKKMYITGGIGSGKRAEAFTIDYDLPNKTSYTETCAAISLAFFSHRMGLCELDGKYGDVFERVIYNAFPAGVSLNGSKFFYCDPLEISPRLRKRNKSLADLHTDYPISQRVAVFDCSCCPPNVLRFTADMGAYIYSFDNRRVAVNQFMSSKAVFEIDGRKARIETVTDYPASGSVSIKAENLNGKKLCVRIPGWCDNYSVTVGGQKADFTVDRGYAVFNVESRCFFAEFDFEMNVKFIEANSLVEESAGKVAVSRGPVVYCMEGVDNGEGLHTLEVNTAVPDFAVEKQEGMLNCVTLNGRRKTAPNGSLYHDFGTAEYEERRLKLIPYYCFANRGESEMLVWMMKY
ncbi:MAG: glycoside hydrolase family 127 protein, partial [Firmicutes bacterium]|nr:glycoside hydrolase family 127 protein [Bacillota bacterium]